LASAWAVRSYGVFTFCFSWLCANRIGFVSANRHFRRATPRGGWLVVSISCQMEQFRSADQPRVCTVLGMNSPSSLTISRYAPPPYFWVYPIEHDSQTISFFVSVVLVNLLLQCVSASLACIGFADQAIRTEMGNPITWKVLC
jgi:hypothetical protein